MVSARVGACVAARVLAFGAPADQVPETPMRHRIEHLLVPTTLARWKPDARPPMDSAQPGGGDEAHTLHPARSVATLVEALDISIDQLLESGLIKDLPVVGWLARLPELPSPFGTGCWRRKSWPFSQVQHSIPGKVSSFLLELSDPKTRERAGETIMMLIDRHERFENPTSSVACWPHESMVTSMASTFWNSPPP